MKKSWILVPLKKQFYHMYIILESRKWQEIFSYTNSSFNNNYKNKNSHSHQLYGLKSHKPWGLDQQRFIYFSQYHENQRDADLLSFLFWNIDA